ncbi:MAG: hypothetical protein M1150_03425 [Patescibacteria group bacterium]|nr:hypothetical protein [Patescibacteria group bacterium]
MDLVLKTMIAAVESGGEVLKKYFGESLAVEEKTHVFNFRTKADLESEEKILHVLIQNFPDYNLLSEEAGFLDKKSEFTFVLGLPYFSINLALLKGEEVIAGVVGNPILDRIYFAEKGWGFFR